MAYDVLFIFLKQTTHLYDSSVSSTGQRYIIFAPHRVQSHLDNVECEVSWKNEEVDVLLVSVLCDFVASGEDT